MILTILNRNKEEDYEYSEKSYQIDEGHNITECFNETLDSGVVIISNLSEKIKMEPYDIAVIDDDKYFCIDTYTETMISVNPKLYRYEIHLFSQTKILENIVLPNLKITKEYSVFRDVFYYINQYMEEYCPKIRIRTNKNVDYYNYEWRYKILWDTPTNRSKFSMECPEMQWNTPTLREVLNDLMMVADCIPVIKRNSTIVVSANQELSFLDLTATPSTNPDILADITDDSHINYVTRSKSSEDYISELQVKLENVTNNVDNVNNTVTKAEYVPFDIPQDDATSTTQNILIKTKYPIYKLKSVEIMFPASVNYEVLGTQNQTVNVQEQQWCKTDLMYYNLIAEYQEWITKILSYGTLPPTALADFQYYQNWSLYYTRGTNEIKGFQNSTKFKWLPITSHIFEEICKRIIQIQIETHTPGAHNIVPVVPNWYNVFFRVEYETLEGCLFRASKNDIEDNDGIVNDRIVIDNQTNSYVDSYSQGFLEYQKANRLGNEQVQINARYESDYTGHMMRIGDVYDDSVIYQCQYQYFKNHIEVNAIATKNYVLREYFTGVKSKIRSWQVVSGSEALTRHDVSKYYCEFSYQKYVERYGIEKLAANDVPTYLCSPIAPYEHRPLKYAFVRTEGYTEGNHPALDNGEVSYYLVDLMTRVVGNSLVMTFAFDDNLWAGKGYATTLNSSSSNRIDFDDIKGSQTVITLDSSVFVNDRDVSTGGVGTVNYKYADNNGENYYNEVIFAYDVKVGELPEYLDVEFGDNWYDSGATNNVTIETKCFLWGIYQRPRVFIRNLKSEQYEYNYEVFRNECYYHKDSQEITNISTQLEFCTDTRDISFGKEWLLRQQAVKVDDNNVSNLKLRFYDSEQYNFRRPNDLPTDGYVENSEGYASVAVYSTENVTAGLYIAYLKTAYGSETDARNAAMNLKNDEHGESNKCVYLCDSGKVLLSLNNIPDSNCFGVNVSGSWYPAYLIHLNILKSRNKCLYINGDTYEVYCKMNKPV